MNTPPATASWIATEYAEIIGQLDQILRLLGGMLDCHPCLRGDITARINSVLDERNRVCGIARSPSPNPKKAKQPNRYPLNSYS